MKTENIEAAILLLEARPVGDNTYGAAVAKAAREELAALSPPAPEDVARNADWLATIIADARKMLDGSTPDGHFRSRLVGGEKALARLRDWAARVPGLEVRVAELEAESKARLALADVWKARTTAAESERDAARKEVDLLKAQYSEEREGNRAKYEEIKALRSQVATLEREVVAYEATTQAVAVAAGVAFPASQEDVCRGVGTLKARAEAAERRVAELEGLLRESKEWMGKAVTTLDATHPAPAGLLETVRETLEEYDEAKQLDAWDSDPAMVNVSERMETLRNRLAAYDAAKGGEDANAQKAAKWDAAMERAKDAEAMVKAWCIGGFAAAPERAASMARYLGLTLDTPPSGPGGGETSDSAAEAWARADQQNDAQRRAWAAQQQQRQRQPTPTPKGPALTDRMDYPMPEDDDAQPEPAAPEVVIEGAGTRVLVDGTQQEWDADERVWCTVTTRPSVQQRVTSIARALAEAMRELRTAEVALSQWRDTADGYARKAAESMRERCVYAAGEYAEVLNGAARTAVLALRDRLHALPLEDK